MKSANAIPYQGIQPQCKRYTLSGDTTPQSFRLVNKPKIQLPLHRGAEIRPPSERCGFCTVGFRVPPVADTTRKASCCRPQVRERIAEARAANGEGAENAPQALGGNPATGEPRTHRKPTVRTLHRGAENAPQAGLFPACPRRKIGI